MKVRRPKLKLTLTVGAALLVGAAAHRHLAFPWDVRWVQSATSLTFTSPRAEGQQTLTKGDLRHFLEGLATDNGAAWGMRCFLGEDEGTITIGGEEFPFHFQDCKFEGASLLVQTSWKTVTLYRRDA